MPELPDVEVFRRRFAAGALNLRIEHVQVRTPRIVARLTPTQLKAQLKGHCFRVTRRYGKRLYVGLDGGGWLSLHFGMSGALEVYEDEQSEPAFARMVIDFEGRRRFAYTNRRMIGRVEFVADPSEDVRAKQLGPDALDPRLTLAAFKRVLEGRRGSLKSVLMEQSVIAGIGNAYSDEILFQARLHPQTSVAALDRDTLGRLFRTMRRVLKQAVASGAEPARLPATFLIPRRRAGQRCPCCNGPVRSYRVGERNGYFCPACQKPPSPAR
jgi:formamidopyrimidine-DNA glycosylase